MAKEWLTSDAAIEYIVGSDHWLTQNSALLAKHSSAKICVATQADMAQITSLSTPGEALIVACMPQLVAAPVIPAWYLLLDRIQDPGNMGTIIRIADWFGIPNLVCSPGCVDVYNPKVVQSGMGGHLRVNIFEEDLATFIPKLSVPVYAATLSGDNLYQMPRSASGALIIGNESKGIAQNIVSLATKKVTIPAFGGAESLNAGVAAGILCAFLVAG